ncbi:hypothetical protein AUQ48_05060 [Kocuria flava]|uniref:Uncharacterized protein n=1 Tax=Kocuria flava TaxID=446860 RepID=A0A2N4T0G0_9MICC|nr:hypothetical protein AUQ48_05060 [Kocuria flava]
MASAPVADGSPPPAAQPVRASAAVRTTVSRGEVAARVMSAVLGSWGRREGLFPAYAGARAPAGWWGPARRVSARPPPRASRGGGVGALRAVAGRARAGRVLDGVAAGRVRAAELREQAQPPSRPRDLLLGAGRLPLVGEDLEAHDPLLVLGAGDGQAAGQGRARALLELLDLGEGLAALLVVVVDVRAQLRRGRTGARPLEVGGLQVRGIALAHVAERAVLPRAQRLLARGGDGVLRLRRPPGAPRHRPAREQPLGEHLAQLRVDLRVGGVPDVTHGGAELPGEVVAGHRARGQQRQQGGAEAHGERSLPCGGGGGTSLSGRDPARGVGSHYEHR